jgi:hypothetical protein
LDERVTNRAAILADLLAFARAEGRVCPNPQLWHALWEMLPRSEGIGGGWNPPLPLILGAWWCTSVPEKQLRLREHIEYAAQHEVLGAVDSFLWGLAPEQWHRLEDA